LFCSWLDGDYSDAFGGVAERVVEDGHSAGLLVL
jgi:hypothetical protein